MSGQLIAASIVARPNSAPPGPRSGIKEGRVPEDWQAKPAKLRQKNHDASGRSKRARPNRARREPDGRFGDPRVRLPEPILAPTAGPGNRTRERAYPVLPFREDVLCLGPDGGLGRVRAGVADRHRSVGRASCSRRGSPARVRGFQPLAAFRCC